MPWRSTIWVTCIPMVDGGPQNHTEAVRWYRMAAEQGFAVAQFKLGEIYLDGLGVPQNHTEAVRWLRMAAEQGDTQAQFKLGYMYATGEGGPKKRYRGSAMVSHSRRAGSSHGAVQSGSHVCHRRRRSEKTMPRRCGGFAWPPSKGMPI